MAVNVYGAKGKTMSKEEAIKWLMNLRIDIGKSEHQALWYYEQALIEIICMLDEEGKDNEDNRR